MKTKTEEEYQCNQCKEWFDTIHLWKCNHPMAITAVWLCEFCFIEKNKTNAKHLLRSYNTAKKKNNFTYLNRIYDNSTERTKLSFLDELGGQVEPSV